MTFNLDLVGFWQQGDAVSHAVLLLLFAMSVTSWAIIISKSVQLAWLQHGNNSALERFWQAENIEAGLRELGRMQIFCALVQHGQQALASYRTKNSTHASSHTQLNEQLSTSELLTRALRQGLNRATAQLENGQVILASVGSVSPFIGLFGTVWGIYHALAVIGNTGQASLDKVAGPVGEALIMTALGLFVAIPAVLAYNAFTRAQRLIVADLDGFAHDLHLYFSTQDTGAA
ncbi:MAG TPA: MotA/TolQ/ExbB proton channel family protein [Pseudomonadales bacterium]|nr:MotA/TolQ/ExbB proton channel family protein [Pseudomonadales bacterium]